jgi:hypothetical protein
LRGEVERYRIVTAEGDGPEQTWVLLPDEPSAVMQAEEYAQRHRTARVLVYRETVDDELRVTRELVRELGVGAK